MSCDRCKAADVVTGSLGVVYLRATGDPATSLLRLCGRCADLLWRFLHDPVEHVRIGDPVTPWGSAHIMTCTACAVRFGART